MARLDPYQLLRDLTAARDAVRAYLEARRASAEATAADDPYEPRRYTSALSTLRELDPRDPARPYLTEWVLWLLLGRTCRGAEVAELRAREAAEIHLDPREALSLRQAAQRLVGARTEGERKLLADALARAAAAPGAAALELWMRRGEALGRAGGEALVPRLIPLATWAELRAQAELALASTDELARALLGRRAGWAEALAVGFGHEHDVPWPRQLGARWLLDPFRGEARWLDVPALDLGPLPPLLGGSSVTRAMARLGARWADAAASRELPRPLAHLPSALARYRTGALFASLLGVEPFLVRGLGMSHPEAERARRQQALVALVALRLEAARTLAALAALRGDRAAAQAEAREHLQRALQQPAPASLALALPRPTPASAARLLSFGLAASDAHALREAHDEDWYRNHRAVIALRDRLGRAPEPSLSAEAASAATQQAAASLARTLG